MSDLNDFCDPSELNDGCLDCNDLYFSDYSSITADYYDGDTDEVGANHPLYNKFSRCWKIMRDSVEGQDAVRSNALNMRYIQVPPGLKSEGIYSCDYNETAEYHYINRAHYIEIVSRILDEVEGRIFSKPLKVTTPSKINLNSLDSEGLDFEQYVRWCVREVFAVSRFGVLVDWDEEIDSPILKRYVAESIVNWKQNKRGELKLLVLEDQVEDEDQLFSHNMTTRRISFEVKNTLDGPVVIQRTWLQEDRIIDDRSRKVFYESEAPVSLEKKGLALKKIPFIFFGGVRPTPPMLKPLSAAALDYYDAHAQMRNALWWAATEQPYFNFKKEGGFLTANGELLNSEHTNGGVHRIVFGSATPILLREGELKYAHVSGIGLEHLRRRLTDIKAEMTGMGARSFNAQTASNIKVQTERMQNRAEGSVIGSNAAAISQGIKHALEIVASWMDVKGPIRFELNKDYTEDFDLKYIGSLIELCDKDKWSEKRFFEFLRDNTNLIPSDMTFEEHEEEKSRSRITFDNLSNSNLVIPFEEDEEAEN